MKCKKIYNEKKSRKCESIKRFNKLSRFFLRRKEAKGIDYDFNEKKRRNQKITERINISEKPRRTLTTGKLVKPIRA